MSGKSSQVVRSGERVNVEGKSVSNKVLLSRQTMNTGCCVLICNVSICLVIAAFMSRLKLSSSSIS